MKVVLKYSKYMPMCKKNHMYIMKVFQKYSKYDIIVRFEVPWN